MNIKKILLLLCVFTLLFCVSVSAKTLELTIGGTEVNLLEEGIVSTAHVEAPLFTQNDRTMVPVRIIAENFGCEVGWIEEEEAVTISKEDKEIKLWLGKTSALVDGGYVTLDVAPMETEGRTFVPVRFISETLGYNVTYVPLSEQVIICDTPDIMTVNGQKVNYAVYEFVMAMNSAGFKYNDEEYKFLSASAFTTLEDLYINSTVAKKLGITYTDGIKESYLMQMNVALASNKALKNSSLKGAFMLYIEECMYSEALANTIAKEIAPTDDSINEKYNKDYYAAKYIFLPQSEKTGKNQLEVIYNNLAKKPDSFDSIMMDKSKDEFFFDYPNGYIYTDGDHEEIFINTLKNLEIGGISKVIALEGDGYYLIKRLALPELNEEFKAMVSDTLYSENYDAAMVKYFSDNVQTQKHITSDDALKLFGGKK